MPTSTSSAKASTSSSTPTTRRCPAMIEVVTQMHARSGLTEEVRASTVDVAAAEEMVLDYIRSHVKQAKTAPLAGNSIAHRPRLHRPRHACARRLPALPDDRRQLASRNCAGAGFRASTSASRRRVWRIARWPTSTSRSANCSITGGPPSSPRPGRRPAISPRSPPNWARRHSDATKSIRLPSARAANIDDAAVPVGSAAMVAVVQLVEHQVVILAVAGSSPVSHPAEVGGHSALRLFLSPSGPALPT